MCLSSRAKKEYIEYIKSIPKATTMSRNAPMAGLNGLLSYLIKWIPIRLKLIMKMASDGLRCPNQSIKAAKG